MRSQVISQCSYLDLVVQTKQVEDEIPPESPQVLRSMFRSWLWIFPPLVILLKIYDYTSRKNWFTLKAFGVLFVCCGLVGAICELVSNSSRSLIGRFFLKKPLAGKPENLSRGRKVERSLQRSRKWLRYLCDEEYQWIMIANVNNGRLSIKSSCRQPLVPSLRSWDSLNMETRDCHRSSSTGLLLALLSDNAHIRSFWSKSHKPRVKIFVSGSCKKSRSHL